MSDKRDYNIFAFGGLYSSGGGGKMRRKWSVLVAAVFLAAVNLCNAAQYEIIDLGTLGGDSSYAHSINEHGQVVGWSETSTGDEHAFFWENGIMTDLGTLGGIKSRAYGINNSGQIVGYAYNSSNDSHAFLWENGVMLDLGTLGGNRSDARAINNIGMVVGNSADEGGFIWEDGIMNELGTAGTFPYGINENGQVVGTKNILGATYPYAFIWEGDGLVDLNTKAAGSSWNLLHAHSINNNGEIVGQGIKDGKVPAFLYSNGAVTNLGTLEDNTHSAAQSINEIGQVVGNSYSFEVERKAFLWEQGEMYYLGDLLGLDSGWDYLERASAINNNGYIVGRGYKDGDQHAFLLIPEPTTLLLLAFGGLALRRRR